MCGRPRERRTGRSDPHADGLGNAHRDTHCDVLADLDPDGHAHADTLAHTHLDTDGHAERHAFGDTDDQRVADRHAFSHAHGRPDHRTHADGHSERDALGYAFDGAFPLGYAFPHGHADGHSYRNALGDAAGFRDRPLPLLQGEERARLESLPDARLA